MKLKHIGRVILTHIIKEKLNKQSEKHKCMIRDTSVHPNTEIITIHHAKGCAWCHKYINHLLRAQSLRQINLQHLNIKNTVQSAWPTFINSIKINADQRMQGQISDLHAQINEVKDALHNMKKSYHNAEAALTKEHSQVKDFEQELKDLKSHFQSEVNASTLPPITLATAEPKLQVVIPAWSLPQPEAGPS